MTRSAFLACALAFGASASAQDRGCDAHLTSQGLEEALNEANAAIRAADIDRHVAAVQGLERSIHCLDFVPSPEQWADLLVGVSIVAFALKEEWEDPLATALHIHPRVNRLVGHNHPIFAWEPPLRPAPTDRRAPEGVRVFYDGELVEYIPRPGGWHLAQRRDADGLQSRLLRDEPIPEDWLLAPELESKRRNFGWGFASIGTGPSLLRQAPDRTGSFLSDVYDTNAELTAETHGWLRVIGAFGMAFDVGAVTLLEPGLDASLGPAWSTERWTASVGVGAVTLPAQLGDDDQLMWIFHPAASVAWRPKPHLNASLEAAWVPALTMAHLRIDQTLLGDTGGPFIGVGGRVASAHFELLSEPVRDVPVLQFDARLHVGLRWGRSS